MGIGTISNVRDALSGYKSAAAFFWAVHRDVTALRAVDRDIAAGVDSMPQTGGGGRGSGISKPTENRALFLMTSGAAWLQALQDKRERLIYEIGCGLMVCEFVRDGLGEKYGAILEAKYIDQMIWRDVAERFGYSESHAKRLGGIALDWLDFRTGGGA